MAKLFERFWPEMDGSVGHEIDVRAKNVVSAAGKLATLPILVADEEQEQLATGLKREGIRDEKPTRIVASNLDGSSP